MSTTHQIGMQHNVRGQWQAERFNFIAMSDYLFASEISYAWNYHHHHYHKIIEMGWPSPRLIDSSLPHFWPLFLPHAATSYSLLVIVFGTSQFSLCDLCVHAWLHACVCVTVAAVKLFSNISTPALLHISRAKQTCKSFDMFSLTRSILGQKK